MALSIALLQGAAHAEEKAFRVLAVKSVEAPIYNQVIEAMHQRLADTCPGTACQGRVELEVTTLDGLRSAQVADLYVSIGRLAGLAVAEKAAGPSIYGLIPEATWQEIRECCPNAWSPSASALFLDQPLPRQLKLVTEVLPDVSRIGVLYGPASRRWKDSLQQLAKASRIELVTQEIHDEWEVGPALDLLLDDVDALLALPDPSVYNRETLYGVLLTTYRKGVPVFGYAQSLAQAGAVAVVYSSPQDVGQQLMDMSLEYLKRGRKLTPPVSLRNFEVKLNNRVLRSLGLEAPPSEEIHARLLENER